MSGIPQDLAEAIAQARSATLAALDEGLTLIQVELVLPELKVMPVAESFLAALEPWGDRLKIFFPDAGAAALARRDWGDRPFRITDVGSGRTPMTGKVQPEDGIFLFIEPSAVEVTQVEQLCQEAGDRPVIFLNPRMEDLAIIGIGYAGRQLRDRFLNRIVTAYYLRPIEGAAVRRAFPGQWEVWLEPADENADYQLVATRPQRPAGEALDEILLQATGGEDTNSANAAVNAAAQRQGFLGQLQNFLKALSN
ncbi:hypothetical protein AMR42_08755 [Limnothrix sp. PR1529]|uniref:DUF1995 family protein n=1 Tax=Limnothrix sp. PR1529 TaxID=1704291 RepID=UPI00081EC600|nr:DUF1995 family protein [Limnothrix sp. PR1529]OCQ91489.1 hypothetical protein BCR12_11730 [Limnothrix sp. P13C2]PIB13284.1 hypothetical protein AMR42_08755 [Limnothrix sp. PR1529]